MSSKTNIKRSLGLSFLIFLLFLFSAEFALADGEMISDNTCLDCHDGMEKTLSFTPHNLKSTSSNVSCVSCHSGAEIHIEDPSTENIINPKNVFGFDALIACFDCHKPHSDLDNLGFDVHQTQELNCSSCHKIHTNDDSQLRANDPEICYSCHAETNTKFSRRSNHPVSQGVMTCLSCHQFTKKQDANYAFDLARTCQSCHPEQGGPFLFEHEPVNGYSVEGSGCIECHDPHGSENDRLLKQKGNKLCNQCHIEHVTTNHASQWELNWSKLACNTCHIDTHGSFTNHNYLDPNMEATFGGNCYNSGCHSASN